MRPIDVTLPVAKRLLSTVYSHVKIAPPTKFKIDDPVRVSKFKTIFKKGYTPNWSTEIFHIAKVQRTNPATYLLRDYREKPIVGGFYEYELVIFANNKIYMIDYPSFQLKNGWPKTYSDLNFPAEMRVNTALVTNRGQTYVIFDGDSVALMNEYDMTISEYHSLKSIFPGIPPSAAYRHIDGSFYFLQKRQYFKFNEFTRTVTNADNFDMKILNVNCPTDGLLRQLQDLLNRLLQSSNLLESTAEDALDE
ncbi:hypothetical protein ALC62_06654 [Cyphomyrmex costatus]|uniref:Matrix metalloproteinase-14 n=1 Tax=Cyphomyrmex costatus TaxID=456900 RepID=A0A151IIP1_9HYME|nr:hypothetical protein ALC62_06654 [Cyphomyrmex costatus]